MIGRVEYQSSIAYQMYLLQLRESLRDQIYGRYFFLYSPVIIGLCIQNAKVLLFADDIKLYLRIQLEDNCALLQEDVSRVSNW